LYKKDFFRILNHVTYTVNLQKHQKKGTKSSYNPNKKLFGKPIRDVNVIGSPEGFGQAVQPEFNCSAFSRNETLAVGRRLFLDYFFSCYITIYITYYRQINSSL
jgi:hypothetical protein